MKAKNKARMIDVGEKPVSRRRATARGFVALKPATLALIRAGKLAKGDPVELARVAGIMAAKRTAEIVPLCHPLALDQVTVDLEREKGGLAITAAVAARQRTGVEMEALTAVAAAALTVYDLCKSVERGAEIREIHLLEKSGGRSGDYRRGPKKGRKK